MGHDRRGRLVVSLDSAELEGNPRRHHQPLVGELGAIAELHDLADRVDTGRRGVDDLDPVTLRQPVIAVRQRIERAQPGEIKVAEEARDVALLGLDQGDAKPLLREVARGRRPADAPADHHDRRFCLGFDEAGRRDGCERRAGAGAELAAGQACHGFAPCPLLAR